MSRSGLSLTSSVLLLLATAAGCGPSRPARIPAPPLDPAAVAAAASSGDLNKLPAIAAGRVVLDTDKDKKVSQGELLKWLEEVRDSKVAITSIAVQVSHKGKPLSGAEIRLVPEACMAGGIKEASGKTDQSGMSMVTIPGSEYPGVNCGLYRVEITGNGNDGRPLAAKYNAQSTLGVAVGGMLPENGMAIFELN
ncbi:MAG: hypothetical protein EBX35_04100 [Planctomycetia bacterium]|nr:hypothetical protein [Planctomycetia bacterium]